MWIRCVSRAELTITQDGPAALGVLCLGIAIGTSSEDGGFAGFETVYEREEDEREFLSSSEETVDISGNVSVGNVQSWFDVVMVMVLLGRDVGRDVTTGIVRCVRA